MRQVSLKAISEAKKHGDKIVLDLDYRPTLWGQAAKGDGERRYVSNAQVSRR